MATAVATGPRAIPVKATTRANASQLLRDRIKECDARRA
ncbi:hypothetical protein SAMCFNEI73_Ch2357 [Sinorhizobium americanum]|nr:hypothetical protein SAMCCGM7_Ch2249 [Sinorhizobium americanum CCGM7]APG91637.1 hypothetical protein SAMCFNEI73_Ch2357 [Sinorhizobium americanum]